MEKRLRKYVSVCIYMAIAGAMCTVFALAAEAPAEPTAEKTVIYGVDMGKIGYILVKFLVLSVLFESALTPLFNWRVFLARFDEKGLKTPITVLLAFLTFWIYDLDIFREVMISFGMPDKSGVIGKAITALLIAGGSDAILRIFNVLHLRDLDARERKASAAKEQLQIQKERKVKKAL